MTIKLHLKSPLWQSKLGGAIQQRGTCWQSLDNLLEVSNMEQVSQVLQRQNGFYALVWQQQDKTYAAVDHVRSIPLFYAQKDKTFYLSDDAEWVREEVGNMKMDPLAKEEFQLAGYVTGRDTLFKDVKQLQAGELLMVDKTSTGPILETERYYRFLHTEPGNYSESELYQQLDEAALASIDNLIRYAKGRQIVIPLSGGYDSRLIATLLKRRGYDNIITFAYGVLGRKESAYSKKVADALGLRWHFVEYSNELWRNAWQTEDRKKYQRWASGWSSLPHVQDWLAIKVLKEKAIVNEDCIFVPGHGAMAVLSHLVGIQPLEDHELLMKSVMQRKFNLAPATNDLTLKVGRKLKEVLEDISFLQKENLSSFSTFEWQERQAKFLVNSVRVYEYYNYSWWIPLWDMRFLELWQNVPRSLRGNKDWYVSYVKNIFNEHSDWEGGDLNNAADNASVTARLKALPFLRSEKVREFARKIIGYNGHLGTETRYPKKKSDELKRKGYISNGITAWFFLHEVEEADA